MRQEMTTIYQPIMWAKNMKESKDERSVPTQEALAIACFHVKKMKQYLLIKS